MLKNFNKTGCMIGTIIGFILTISTIGLLFITNSWIPILVFLFLLFVAVLLPFIPSIKTIPDLNVGLILGVLVAFLVLFLLVELPIFDFDN
jgi:hypothetical protein